jgi:hypothetical protein
MCAPQFECRCSRFLLSGLLPGEPWRGILGQVRCLYCSTSSASLEAQLRSAGPGQWCRIRGNGV